MKKIYSILIIGFSLLFSCSEDLGNYDYQDEIDMGGVYISDLNTNGTVEVKEKIDLIASVSFPASRDKNDFKSYWIAHRKGIDRLVDTLGIGEHLSYVVSLPIGDYSLQYIVNDSVYGVQYTKWTNLNVSGAPDGWMFLEKDAEGMADISMYAYNSKRKRIFISNILSSSGVADEMRRDVAGIHSTSGRQMLAGNYGLWVEGKKTYLLEPDNGFSFTSTYLSDFSVEDSRIFEGKKIIRPVGSYSVCFVFGNDKVYQSMQNTSLFLSEISTYYEGENLPLAPFFAPSMGQVDHLVFETKNNRFMLLKGDGLASLPPPYPGMPAFPEGDKALYFSHNAKNYKVLMQSLIGRNAPPKSYYEYRFTHYGMITMPEGAISGEHLYHLNEKSCVEYTISTVPSNQLYYSNAEKLYTVEVDGGKFIEVPVKFQGAIQLEGEITCLYCHRFKWMTSFPEFAENAQYLVISTKKPDGTGMVYFAKVKENEPDIVTLTNPIVTQNPVYSVTFCERS